MYIAIDDTDGEDGGCTTFVMYSIIRGIGLDLIGYPTLVRLNPNIPYKTRGNAALSARFGIGRGTSFKIGEYSGENIYAYPEGDDVENYNHFMERAWSILETGALPSDKKTQPGMIVSNGKGEEGFYVKAVREVVSLPLVINYLVRNNVMFKKMKRGRGLIGAMAALSWPSRKRTYEMIFYRKDNAPLLTGTEKLEVAARIDNVEGTFNNIDRENGHASIFPAQRTPILCGVRAYSPECFGSVRSILQDSLPESSIGYMTYMTNQASDDQYIHDPSILKPLRSYVLNSVFLGSQVSIKGGHWFFSFSLRGTKYRAAVFEPSKQLRSVLKQVQPGDYIRLYGSYKKSTLNVEKVEILQRARIFARHNPECKNCRLRMKNIGRFRYKCNICGAFTDLPGYDEIKRKTDRNEYEVPVASRRHLVASLLAEEGGN